MSERVNQINDLTNLPHPENKNETPTPLHANKTKEMRRLNICSSSMTQSQSKNYCTNSIKTAKYNYFTFLPLAILYQFNNYFNVFFLVTAIVSSIREVSSLDPGTALAPFSFVLIISLIREAFEDLKKTRFDKLYNNSPTQVWKDSFFKTTKWKDVSVGQITKVEKNEIIPADLLVIKSAQENGFCYLETTNLDGESALKPREAMIITNTMLTSQELVPSIRGFIEVDPPNNDIYTVEGTLFLEGYERSYFDINNVLLRGGRLKNVEWVWGIVIYTGKDTKIMKNIKQGSLKLSSIDTKLNKIVIYILIVVILLCVICTIFGAFFRTDHLSDMNKNSLGSWYLFTIFETFSVLEVIKIFGADFIIFNTLIPISLMISYQVAKGFQIVLIEKDPELASDPDDQVKTFSIGLHEDLGSIKYIFSDKTGTLTRNEMEFKALSNFTKLFDDEDEENRELEGKNLPNLSKLHEYNRIKNNEINLVQDVQIPKNKATKTGAETNSNWKKKSAIAASFDRDLISEVLTNEIPLDFANLDSCPFKSYKDAMMTLFLNIALNHNVLTEFDTLTNTKSYQGSNPDEVTLVSAVSELGIKFMDRQNKFIRVECLGNVEEFEILHKFDFSSARMRSSIIVKDSSGVIKLYMKGADTVIFQKVDKFSSENIVMKSKVHLDSFAKRGLRTLCYSFKTLSSDAFSAWESSFNEIKYQAINDKSLQSKVEETISTIESDLTLLGVTALEDKLQEGVKNDLQQFIEAGINVWMITGDKLDTAESIGHSCKLFNDDTEVFKIRSSGRQAAIDRLKEISDKMRAYEKEVEEMKNKKIPHIKSKNKKNKDNEKLVETKNLNNVKKNFPSQFKGENLVNIKNLEDPLIAGKEGIIIPENHPNIILESLPNTFRNNNNLKNINNIDSINNLNNLNNLNINDQILSQANDIAEKHKIVELVFKNAKSNLGVNNADQDVNTNINTKNTKSKNKNNISTGDLNNINHKPDNAFIRNMKSKRNTINAIVNQANKLTRPASSFNLKSDERRESVDLKEEDLNDVSIMNLLFDKHYFESSLEGGSMINKLKDKLSCSEQEESVSRASIKPDNFASAAVISNIIKKNNMTNLMPVNSDPVKAVKKEINYDIVKEFRRNLMIQEENENNASNNLINNTNNEAKICQYVSLNMNSENPNNIQNINGQYPNHIKINVREETFINNLNMKNLVPNRIKINEEERQLNELNELNEQNELSELNEIKKKFSSLNEKKTKSLFINDREKRLINLNFESINPINPINPIKPINPKLPVNEPENANNPSNLNQQRKHTEKHRRPNKLLLNFNSPDNAENFGNIFDFYKEKIQQIDKRRKSILPVFDYAKKFDDKIEDPEDRAMNENFAYLINFGLMIEGTSITHCLDPEVCGIFWRVIKKCRSVVACRCSPLQKAEIVNFVKNKSGEITLAIGDGGNDVNMIKTANVGVGLFGKEGYQAAYNSDYAISQFKYLKRLLFYHGRYSLDRNSYFIYFFFFKNVVFTLPQFWLCFFSGFSGTNYYDQWYYLGYNSFLTAFPIGAKAIIDEDIDIDFTGRKSREILHLLIPDIYKEYRDSLPFNVAKFFLVFFFSFIYSLIIYFVPFIIYKYGIIDESGKAASFYDSSLCSFIALIIIHFLVIFEDTQLYVWVNTLIYVGQALIIFIFMYIHNLRNKGEVSGITEEITGNPLFWMALSLTSAIALVPFYIARRADLHFSDNIINNLKRKKYELNYAKKIYIKKLEYETRKTRTLIKFRRLYKDRNLNPDNFADKRMKEIVDQYRISRKGKEKRNVKRSKSDVQLYNKISLPLLDKKSTNKEINNEKYFEAGVETQAPVYLNPVETIENVQSPLEINLNQPVVSENHNFSLQGEEGNNRDLEIINLKTNPSRFSN